MDFITLVSHQCEMQGFHSMLSHVHSAKRADLIHSFEFILNYHIFAVNLKIIVSMCVCRWKARAICISRMLCSL